MSRRAWLTAAASALAGAGATAWWAQPSAPRPRRVPELPPLPGRGKTPLNVLLVMSDQERFDLPQALPLPGHERLYERGTRFTQWHANTTPCSPSRAAWYFGQHTQKNGMLANLDAYPGPQIPPHMPSLGHYFRANGYLTAYKGKWQLSEVAGRHELTHGHYPNTREALEPFGFADYNFDGDHHGATWTGYKEDAQIAAEAAQWLLTRGRQSDKPWLLAVNFVNPHDVSYLATSAAQIESRRHPNYLAPLAGPPLDPLYQTAWNLPLPSNRGDDLSLKPWAHRNYRTYCDMAMGRVDGSDAAWQAAQSYYFNCIRDVDRQLVTVWDALQASGQAARTVVVYTSDHGEMGGAHGLRGKGPFMYQENLKVPFVVQHPDVAGGKQSAALGCAVDLVPTLLALVGYDAASVEQAYPHLAGVSVAAPVARPEARSTRDERGILFNHSGLPHSDIDHTAELLDHGIAQDRQQSTRALMAGMRPLPRLDQPTASRGINNGRFKFARYFKPAEHHVPDTWEMLIRHNSLELYDLRSDPDELQNLAHAPEWAKGRVMELNAQLNELIATEVGADLGTDFPGPAFRTRL